MSSHQWCCQFLDAFQQIVHDLEPHHLLVQFHGSVLGSAIFHFSRVVVITTTVFIATLHINVKIDDPILVIDLVHGYIHLVIITKSAVLCQFNLSKPLNIVLLEFLDALQQRLNEFIVCSLNIGG